MREYRSVDPETLRSLVEDSGLSYSQNSVSWIFTCPRCGKAKKLYISKRSGRFVCFRCKETDNFQGRPEFALGELLGESVNEIAKKLYGDVPLVADIWIDVHLIDYFGDDDPIDEEAIEHEILTWPFDHYPIDHPHSARGVEYLKSRGIGPLLSKRYDLRYCPVLRRVYFPISSHGSLYGWQGRLIVPHKYEVDGEEVEALKIVTSKGLRRERLLMFSDRLQGSEHAVICEGPVDAMKAHYCGGNVATMGKAVSREQVELIRNSGVKKVYLALDPDAADEMHRLVQDLSSDVELFEMVPDGEKVDLGAMSFEEVYKLFLSAPRINPGRLFVFIDPKAF